MLLRCLFSLLLFTCLGLPQIQAQSLSVGGAGIFGSAHNALGTNVRAYWNAANHHFCVGPEFTYFYPVSITHQGEEARLREVELNINMHYVIFITHQLGVYPLAGVNWAREVEYAPGSGQELATHSAFGVNFGGGAHFELHPLVLFAEYDYLVSALGQHTVSAGLLYTFGEFGPSKKHHGGGHHE